MSQTYLKSSSAEPLDVEDRKRLVIEVWREWTLSGDAGAASWDVLEAIQAQVTDCLYVNPPQLSTAESLTAKAFMLREGQVNY